jgi:hypothetical protein
VSLLELFLLGRRDKGPIHFAADGSQEAREEFLRVLEANRPAVQKAYRGNHGGGIPVASSLLEAELSTPRA